MKKLINDIYGYNKKILHVITTKKTKVIDKKDFKLKDKQFCYKCGQYIYKRIHTDYYCNATQIYDNMKMFE